MDLERRPGLRQRLQRQVAIAGDRVVQHRVAVAEGAALDVFAGEAHRDGVGEDRGQRQLLGRRPVHRPLVEGGEHGAAPFPAAFELLVDGEALWQGRQGRVERGQPLERHRGPHLGGGAARRHHRHVGHVVLFGLQLGVGPLEAGGVLGHQLVGQRRRHLAARHQRRGVLLPDGGVLRHLLVQLRLGEGRLVALVVPVAAVADQVDQEVEREALAVGPGQPRRLDARLGVVGVDMHNRHLEAAGQSAGVAGRERLVRIGGEPELVVGDEVDGAADVPAGEPRQVERLGDDALAGERRVAVDEDAEHLAAVQPRRALGVDPGRRRAGHTDQHRVDRLEVTRVGRHRDHQRRRHVGTDQPRPGVILHVAHPAQLDAAAPREQRILELGQDLGVRLLHHVREHVQPAAVGHRDEHVLDPRRGGVGDDLVEDRHHQIQPLDREAGLAGKGAVEEALEDLDLGDPIEQLTALDRIQRRTEAARLDRFAQPYPLVGHEHVGEVVAGGGAVDRPQPLDGVVGAARTLHHRAADDRRRQAAKQV